MYKLKVTSIGNSYGIILPEEALAKLNVEAGETLYLNETANGFEISCADSEFEEEMQAARQVMTQYYDALWELAQ
jgi:putative addiction module antidote